MDTLPFYIALFVHIVSLIVAFGSVLVTDFFGLLWLIKYKNITLRSVMSIGDVTQKLIWLGYFGMIVSGSTLIYIKGFIDHLTQIKIFFVLLVGINGIYLHYIKEACKKVSGESISQRLKFHIGFSSFISQLGWWGALTIGFLHRHWRHNIPWPDAPVFWVIGTVVLLIVIGSIGLNLTKRT